MATDIRDMLSREVAGIPVWVLMIVAGGGLGLYIRHRNSTSSSSGSMLSPQDVAAASSNSGAYGAIDPNTGIPYSLEQSGLVGATAGGGGSADGMGTYTSPQNEIADVTGLISSLQPLLGLGAGAGSAPQNSDSIDPVTGVPYGQEVGQFGQQIADLKNQLAGMQGGAGGGSADTSSVPSSHSESPIRHLTPQELHPNLSGRALDVGHRLSQPYFVRRGGVIIEYGRSGHEVGAARASSVSEARREIAKKKKKN